MSICKDCIHYEICVPYVSPNESFPEAEGGCKCFKSKSEEYRKGYEQAIKDFAQRVEKYYNYNSFKVAPALVQYYIRQIAKDLLQKLSTD